MMGASFRQTARAEPLACSQPGPERVHIARQEESLDTGEHLCGAALPVGTLCHSLVPWLFWELICEGNLHSHAF